jgi:hypothetical protein
MDRDTWLKHYDQAPATVQEYLLDPVSAEHESAAQDKLAYDHDVWDRIMDIVWDTVFGGISMAEFRDRIKKVAGDRKPEDVEKAVLFHVVLPLADLVSWDVEGWLQQLGVPLSEVQSSIRVSLRPVSYGAAVRRIAASAKISLVTEEVVRRTRDLLVSLIKGVRTKEGVLEGLQRSQQEGGVGLTREQAEAFMLATSELLATTDLLSEQEYADWYTNKRRTETSEAIDAKQAKSTDEDAHEVAQTAASMPKGKPTGALDQAIESVVAQSGLVLDEYLAKRLRNTVSTRLRDVRNPQQVRSLLERDTKVGGMGLTAPDAERVAGLIENVYQANRGSVEGEERKKIESTMVEQKQKIEERKQRESQEHADWFQKKVAGKQNPFGSAQQISQGNSLRAKGERAQTLDGVAAPAARLTDLTSEVGGLTVAEFRRLGKDAQQAADRIRQKFEALKNESFERWTEGVQAWRSSPLQQTYLKLIAESFSSGTPVAQLAEQKRGTDAEALSAEELGAIIDLNRDIHL